MMNKLNYDKKLPLKMLNLLKKEKNSITEIYAQDTLYTKDDILLLWTDLENYLLNFNEAFTKKQELWNLEKHLYQNFTKKSSYIRVRQGKILICLPYNAIIPLLPIFLLSFSIFNNELIICPNRKTLTTCNFIFNILNNFFETNQFKIKLFKDGGENALNQFVSTKKVDLLFFQGSSKNRNEIYLKCLQNGVDLIYEGEGHQVTVLDDPIPFNEIKKWLSFCNGQLCTTPKIFFINQNFFKDFKSFIIKKFLNYNFILLDKNTDINTIQKNTIFYSPFNSIETVISYLKNHYDFGLQISLFSKKPKTIVEKFSFYLNLSRITVNMNPTFQNSLLPWGGYKKSGYSRVSDFFDKATKTMIIEEK